MRVNCPGRRERFPERLPLFEVLRHVAHDRRHADDDIGIVPERDDGE